MSMNIAIDGPAGAGKSTIAKRVAKELGFIYVDTGAMYRAMALYILRHGVNEKRKSAVAAVCDRIDVALRYVDGNQMVLLCGEDVSTEIRKEEVGNMASVTSVYPCVRQNFCLCNRIWRRVRMSSWMAGISAPVSCRMHRLRYI